MPEMSPKTEKPNQRGLWMSCQGFRILGDGKFKLNNRDKIGGRQNKGLKIVL